MMTGSITTATEGQKGSKFKEDVVTFSDDRFELLNSFELTVPKGYTHATQLATFARFTKDSEMFCSYNKVITDENYAKTNQLVPGKTYRVKIFRIQERVTSKDCLNFLSSQRAILVGAQGISLARQLKKNEFPVDKWTVSFDEKDALWEDADGYHWVPFVSRYSGGGWDFDLGHFENDWHDGDCLFCLCDLSA